MTPYYCQWPDKSVTIISAENEVDLYDKLDVEANPIGVTYCAITSYFVMTDELKKYFDRNSFPMIQEITEKTAQKWFENLWKKTQKKGKSRQIARNQIRARLIRKSK